MTCETPVTATVPIPFSAERAVLNITPPYDTEEGKKFDVQVTLTAPITDGSITHTRKHTYPAAVLAHIVGVNLDTLEPEIDWQAAAPLFAEFNLTIPQ